MPTNRPLPFSFCRARYKQTARKTLNNGAKTIARNTTAGAPSRRPPANLVTRSSGAPARKTIVNSSGETAADHGGTIKKRKRFRPGALALKEIRRYQNTTELLVPRASFQRIVKEISNSIIAGFRFQSTAIIALHFAAEAYAVSTIIL